METEPLDDDKIRFWYATFLADRCICQYCGFDGGQSPEHWVQLQGDHLIPKKPAAEFAEDSLNRVTACYYCNTQKSNFDPAEGRFRQVASLDVRRELIEKTREYLKQKKANIWREGGGLRASYEHMMQRIRDKTG